MRRIYYKRFLKIAALLMPFEMIYYLRMHDQSHDPSVILQHTYTRIGFILIFQYLSNYFPDE